MYDFHIYHRKLPHWRADGATYFVTWRVHPEQLDLAPQERTIVMSAIRHFDGLRYTLHAFVVMNDHVHVLVTPHDGCALQQIVHAWKSFTSNTMQKATRRHGSLWQGEYMDRIVRNESEFVEKARYILNNPQKRWPGVTDYPWAGHEGEPSP